MVGGLPSFKPIMRYRIDVSWGIYPKDMTFIWREMTNKDTMMAALEVMTRGHNRNERFRVFDRKEGRYVLFREPRYDDDS